MQQGTIFIKTFATLLLLGLFLTFLGSTFQPLVPGFVLPLGLGLAVLCGSILLVKDKMGRSRQWFVVLAFLLSLCSVQLTFFMMYQLGLLYFFSVLTESAKWIFWGWILIYGLASPFFLMQRSNSQVLHTERTYNIANAAIIPLTTLFSSIVAFSIWNLALRSVFGGQPGILEMIFGGGFLTLGIGLVISFLAGLGAIFVFNPFEFIFTRLFEKQKKAVEANKISDLKSKIPFLKTQSPDKNTLLQTHYITQQPTPGPPKKLKSRTLIITQIVIGLAMFSLLIYAVVSFRDSVGQIIFSVQSGNFLYIFELIRQLSSAATLLLTTIAGAAVVLFFLMIYGIFADMASRTEFPVTSRKKFFVMPLLYSITVAAIGIPTFFFITGSVLSLPKIESIIVLLLPAFGAFVGLLILAGALPLWVLHRKDAGVVKSILFSARLLFSPIIDVFWSAAASMTGIAIASPILVITVYIALLGVNNQIMNGLNNTDPLKGITDAVIGVFTYIGSSSSLLAFMVPFLVVGIIMAIIIYKKGVSNALAAFLAIMAFIIPISTIVFTYFISTDFGAFSGFFWGIIFVPLAIICVIYFITYLGSAFLVELFKISGIFGLAILISSIALLILPAIVSNITILGPIVMGIITSFVPWLTTVISQVGIIGIIVGITIIILALRTREEKQVFNNAIAISIGASTVLPFVLVWGIGLTNLGGGLIACGLVFLLISPIYLISVTLLRLNLAVQTFINPKKASATALKNSSDFNSNADTKEKQTDLKEPWYGER